MRAHGGAFADYVYFENFPSTPYNIRRIEELNKVLRRDPRIFFLSSNTACVLQTANETVEAKVVCLYRRRDLPLAMLRIADKAERHKCARAASYMFCLLHLVDSRFFIFQLFSHDAAF